MLLPDNGEYYHTWKTCAVTDPAESANVIICDPMYKLVILIEPQDHSMEFDRRWPEFLAAAERLPGLRREVTSHVDRVLSGAMSAHMVHELHFDSLKAAGAAMASPEGQAAGALLQEISGGKVTLMLGDHSQDDLAHIQKHVQSPTHSSQQAAPQGRLDNVPPGNRA
jgi:uncharacterized protein (TIGR02118 family)